MKEIYESHTTRLEPMKAACGTKKQSYHSSA